MVNIIKQIREATLCLMNSRKNTKRDNFDYRLTQLEKSIQNILEALEKINEKK